VPGMGKNPTVTYAEQKDKIKVTVDGVDKDGKPTHGVWVGKWDGKAYPEKGNLSWNSAAYKVVNDRTNDITTMKDGKPRHGVWMGKADGKTYKVKGNLAWDAAAYKVVNDHTYGITTMKGGKVFTNGESTVSADGKTRTVTVNGTDADGKKFKSKAVYDKE